MRVNLHITFRSETSNISRSFEDDDNSVSDEEFINTREIQNKNSRIKHPQIQRIANELRSSSSRKRAKRSKSSLSNSTFSHQLKNGIRNR